MFMFVHFGSWQMCCCYRGSVDDGAVGGDGVLALLHHGHLVAAVVRGVGQTVDGAALRAG